jgi:hypothetical protein
MMYDTSPIYLIQPSGKSGTIDQHITPLDLVFCTQFAQNSTIAMRFGHTTGKVTFKTFMAAVYLMITTRGGAMLENKGTYFTNGW